MLFVNIFIYIYIYIKYVKKTFFCTLYSVSLSFLKIMLRANPILTCPCDKTASFILHQCLSLFTERHFLQFLFEPKLEQDLTWWSGALVHMRSLTRCVNGMKRFVVYALLPLGSLYFLLCFEILIYFQICK